MINRKQKTVFILRDSYPEYNCEDSDFIAKCVEGAGYMPIYLTLEKFMKARTYYEFHGFALIVPDCENLPLEVIPRLGEYSRNVGSVLYLGGPLFLNHVAKDGNGKYVDIPFEDSLDADLKFGSAFVREGIAPSYKVFCARDITRVKRSPNQSIFDGEIKLCKKEDVIIPCETNNGVGFETEAKCRFIPLAECYDDADKSNLIKLGRQNGRRGAFASIVLEKTVGDGYNGQAFYGIVDNAAIGSASALIGAKSISKTEGMEKLITSILLAFSRGLYLFEGGADGIRYRKGDCMTVGARVLNTTNSFKKVTVKISVGVGKDALCFEEEKLVSPKSICRAAFSITHEKLLSCGLCANVDYGINAALFVEGEKIDEITSVYSYEEAKQHTPDEFVKVSGRKFTLGGKPWFMAGMNYWQSYYQSKEIGDYWMGLFDKSNYNPDNVEDDLEYIEKLGLNCLLTRLDYSDFDRIKHGLRDFLTRCERHNLKVWISNPKVTSTKYFDREALLRYFDEVYVANNPTLMCFDMEWETANLHKNPLTQGEFYDEWEAWLIDNYGSIEKAEASLGVSLEKEEYGYVGYPKEQTVKGNEAVRSFINDCINRYWKEANDFLRPLVPNQLITFRHGGNPFTPGFAQAVDYIDFTPLEVYGFAGLYNGENPERDKCVGLCVASTSIQEYETQGKPVVWAEYGYGISGNKWVPGSFKFDRKNMKPYDYMLDRQTQFNKWMQEVVEESDCAGIAPWWWCAGFRYAELSDYGLLYPSGYFNPSGENYISFCRHMAEKVGESDTREEYVLEASVDKYTGGKEEMIKSEAIPAYIEAKKLGKKLSVKTVYSRNHRGGK